MNPTPEQSVLDVVADTIKAEFNGNKPTEHFCNKVASAVLAAIRDMPLDNVAMELAHDEMEKSTGRGYKVEKIIRAYISTALGGE